jgi:phage-related protein (TIGR01555 family)
VIDRIRRWLLGDTSPRALAVAAPEPDGDKPITISYAAMWEADRHGGYVPDPSDIFERPKPPAGVLPAGLAMDSALPPLGAMNNYALAGAFHEGLMFLGFPYLAELAQRAEYRMMAEKWAEHATRKWIEIDGLPDERKAEMDEFLGEGDAGLKVRSTFQQVVEGDWLFGRFHIFPDFGRTDGPELAKPLLRDKAKISPERPLRALRTVEPMWIYPGPYEATNPLDEKFYKPDQWYVNGQTVHTSRLLTVIGREVPDLLKPAYAFGGLSMTQMAKPYVDNWLRARQAASDTLEGFSQWILKTNMGAVLQGGGAQAILDRVALFNKWRVTRGTAVIDKGSEELDNRSTPLSGIDKLQAQAQEHLSSVSGIPMVILLGVTPSGLNASSDSELEAFRDAVHAYQEKALRQPIQAILDFAQLSLWGTIDPKVTFKFVPLEEMSEAETADLQSKHADTHGKYVNMGVVDNQEVRDKVTNDKNHPYHGLTGPAPEIDDGDGGDDE